MERTLPAEISEFFRFFESNEQKLVNSSDEELKNLEDIANFFYKHFDNTKSSSAWVFVLSRTLYHVGFFSYLQEIYNQRPSPETAIWYCLWLLAMNKTTEFKGILEEHKTSFFEGPFLPFYYYLWCRYHYRYRNIKFYREFRDKMLNVPLEQSISTINEYYSKLLFYAQIYMMIVDVHFIKDTEILTLALDKAEEMNRLARMTNDRIFLTLSVETFGKLELYRGNYRIAYQYFLRAQAIAEESKFNRELVQIYCSIGELYTFMGHFKESLFWLNKALEKVKEWPKDLYGLVKVHSHYADVYLFFDKVEKAKEEMEYILQTLPTLKENDLNFLTKYVEILLYLNENEEAEKLMQRIIFLKEKGQTLTQENYVLYLQAFLEYNKQNFGKAETLLKRSIEISDYAGNEYLSYKALALLLVIFLWKYNFNRDLTDLNEADKCIEDIIAYMKEKAKYEAVTSLLYTRAKIKIELLDFETAFYLLKEGERFAKKYAPDMLKMFREKVEKLEKIRQQEKTELEIEERFNYEMKNLLPLLQKESKKLMATTEENPFALLILHASGIPIRSYLSDKVQISDDLLFGGFVSAIKNLIDELFVDKSQGFLSVDRGQYKLLLEFYGSVFSIVIIALRDSFMLRRKLHMLVEQIVKKDIFEEKFRGKVTETALYELDSIVKRLFNLKHYPIKL